MTDGDFSTTATEIRDVVLDAVTRLDAWAEKVGDVDERTRLAQLLFEVETSTDRNLCAHAERIQLALFASIALIEVEGHA